ncbi:MAG: NAD(+) synthase [Ruminococcaceae bacterium]|nr:NAD(+) synthase [Oscillospiraceae bacterium]
MNYGFIKTACATPTVKVADCFYNSEQIVSQIAYASQKGATVVVFPELCVTGYTCGDLFLHNFLLTQAENAIKHILMKTKSINIIAVVGVPVAFDDALYNCAAVLYQGRLLGLVPKINIPSYSYFDQMRYFKSGEGVDKEITYASQKTYLSSNLVFSCNQLKEFKLGVEIGEDIEATSSPSLPLTHNAKATVIANLSASVATANGFDYIKSLVSYHSSKLSCAYLLASAGPGESTTDAVFSAYNVIAESSRVLSESEGYTENVTFADIDVKKITVERRKNCNFSQNKSEKIYREIPFDITLRQTRLERKFGKLAFIPEDKAQMQKMCMDSLKIQSIGLATRMKSADIEDLVLGVSGGLDSTLALIVSIKALDILGLDHKHLHAVSMPCFGTTKRTKSNAQKLSEVYGAQFKQIDITKSVRQHFSDIGHDEKTLDTTFENSQARMRTTVLMDIANELNALVVGTGDLSELALGWATYNGDHMSMYAVNASVPKTMVRCIVEYEADRVTGDKKKVLKDILSTPVSPELLPPDKNGDMTQITENVIGPYELHDMFLFCFVQYEFTPEKIFYIALKAFEDEYDRYTIKKYLHKFFQRFFTQQFKRSCMPDGPKVSCVSLSPRGEFRMPSDAQVKMWLDRINEL